MEKLVLIKVGGKIVEEEETLRQLLNDFAAIEGYKVLVHGGGRSATKLAAQLGIESKMVNGRRITDAETLKVVTMVYGGLVNKNIVAGLQALGVNALGLTGADMNLMRSDKRPVAEVDYGFVGDVKEVNADLLASLIHQGIVPVLAPLTHDKQGHMLNTNADTIAGEAAKALAKHFEVTLMFCFEKKGVLLDENDDESVIPEIDRIAFKGYVEQGIIAGCAGGGFENICVAADILKGASIGADAFTLSVYPASTPIYMELAKNGTLATLIETGAIVKTAFCGPCFGAGDTPANNAFSIRHSTRNFPNREGSKIQNGQISSVALMDARSIAATAANKGRLTPATEYAGTYSNPKYYFDGTIYKNRVFDSKGVADPSVEIQFGPNIKDWPQMPALAENLILKVVSEIHDPVTTTDELIPSGETSSFRSNPLGLAEFTLSRKDPAYVGRAKEVQVAEKAIQNGECPAEALPELKPVFEAVHTKYPQVDKTNVGVGSTIFAVKPGDGSAREQAASCQKVLGGWANIANEYATKRYRSNLINWGMLPFLIPEGDLPFANGDYLFIPDVRKAVEEKWDSITAYKVGEELTPFTLTLGELTDDEREIILKGCLINYYRNEGNIQ